MRASEVIREAKNLLFERGWYQGFYEGDDGSLCLRGAISTVQCGDPILQAFGNDAAHALELAVPGCVGPWNDTPGRTFDDVIEVLDRAEKIAEQREAAS